MNQQFATRIAQLEHQLIAERAKSSFRQARPAGRGRLRGAATIERLLAFIFPYERARRPQHPPIVPETTARRPHSAGAAD